MAGRRIRSGWEFELRGGPLMTLRAVISYRIWIYLIRYWACPNTVDAGLPWKRDIRSYRDWEVEAVGPVHARSYATKSSWSLKTKVERSMKMHKCFSLMSYSTFDASSSQQPVA
jgi:hypothetical protein